MKELKRRGASREKREMGFDRTKNRQNSEREEYDREQEKGKVEWRISREDQLEKGIQRAPEKILKRDHQQRESELRL